jgi:hypothetical protein
MEDRGEKIRSSHSLQEIQPGLVEESAQDGEALGSVTVTHFEPGASKHELRATV